MLPCCFARFRLLSSEGLAWIDTMNQMKFMLCMGKKPSSGRLVAPDSSDIDVWHNLVMSAAVVSKLGKQRTKPRPYTVAGAQG